MIASISPIDGRYEKKSEKYQQYFSEYALIKYRVMVEVKYYIALSKEGLNQFPSLSSSQEGALLQIVSSFDQNDALTIKKIERTTNHDVKAVEYFLKDKISGLGLDVHKEFVHFGLTSQDINNTAVPCSLKDGIHDVHIPDLENVVAILLNMAQSWKEIPLLARTHGQPASPTSLGKEFMVYVDRLKMQIKHLKAAKYYGKFGGATGNFNAHVVTFPDRDWMDFGDRFLSQDLGLERLQFTTQIAHYDHLAYIFNICKSINTILIDLCRDIWTYISRDYFKQKINPEEVGSSAMPHKVNPIDFENAEGNLGMANAIFTFLADKLPISRLQRDLTDSTVLRNIGVPFAHSLIAMKSLEKGLGKLIINQEQIALDLENNWPVVAEAIQNILRREGIDNPYEKLKALTRQNKKIDQSIMHNFIDDLDVSNSLKEELKSITPSNYTGAFPAF